MSEKAQTLRFIHLLPIILSLLASLFILLGTDAVLASHANWTHNYYTHSSFYHEWVCVDAAGSSMSTSTARDRVKNTLRYDNPSSDWHALASNRIYFEFQSLSCGVLTSEQLAGMRMRAYVKDNTSSICGQNVSCFQSFSPVMHSGMTAHAYNKIFFKTSHINGSAFFYHHTIGHEFGHTLGLADPSDCNSVSIMHSAYYGCTDHEWPTSSDRAAVSNIANHYTIPGG